MTEHETSPRRDTDRLIAALARRAGERPFIALPFSLLLSAGTVAALLSALTVVVFAAGPRPDLAVAATGLPTLFKAGATAGAATAGFLLTRAAAAPGAAIRPLACLAPVLAFVAFGVVFDRSEASFSGVRALSGPLCVGVVVLASLPALALLLGVVGKGAPTRPAVAGAATGLLAGSIGAAAYVVACVNDGAGFVALWYGAGIAFVALLGAALGPKTLAW